LKEEKSQNNQRLARLLEVDDKLVVKTSGSDFEKQSDFEKYKRKRRGLLGFFILMFSLLFLIGTGFSFIQKNSSKADPDGEDIKINDFEEYKKGKLSGSISSAMNEKEKEELIESKPALENMPSEKTVKKTAKGKNYQKDEEILEKYAAAIDPATSETSGLNSRNGRRHFVPGGGDSKGGVFIKNNKMLSTQKSLDIHNLQIKVRLEFSIRSTAASTVVATVFEENRTIPKGSKFYGTATGYVNKRTQLSFSKLITVDAEYSIKGFAISGRDPGIESEVTDISSENAASSIKQGMARTVSNIAVKLAGTTGNTGGEAASNTVDPASSEIQKQAEANKMTQEYRVPAGTSFSIYLE
jgi:hypothetical protein